MMRSLLIIFCFISFVSMAFAQDSDSGSPEHRLELAQKMHEFRPVSEQVNKAIDMYVAQLPADKQDVYRTALRNVLNYKAIEKISVDAMADTYTEAELAALVEHYSKPEARSASDKYEAYAGKVYPEIGRMLDQALMRIKTGGETP